MLKPGDLVIIPDYSTPDLDFFANSRIWDDERLKPVGYFDFEDIGIVLSLARDKKFVEVYTNTCIRGWIETKFLEQVK